MKPRLLVHAFIILTASAALALLTTGCPSPVGPVLPTTTSTGSTASTGSISGKVVAIGQADNSGVTVTAEQTDGMKSVAVQHILSGGSRTSKAIAAQATTDASGTYTLTDLQPGTHTVTASSKDALERAVTTSVTVSAGSLVEAPVMKLTKTGEISGTVTLPDRSSYLGIVVYIAGTSFSAMTAENGSYTISWVPARTGYTLVASMDGYDPAMANVNVEVGKTTTVGLLSLPRHVTPTTTGSIAGNAQLDDIGSIGILVYVAGTSFSAMTDPTGAFTINGVPPGTNYLLVANFIGYDSAIVGGVEVVAGQTKPAGTLKLKMHVTPPTTGSVSGTATLILNGAAADDNASIFVYLVGSPYICVTNATGSFSLLNVARGTYTIAASKEGFSSSSSSLTVNEGIETGGVALTLHATRLKVTYNANGAVQGAIPTDSNNYAMGQEITVLGNPGGLSRDSYALVGWNTKDNGNGVTYTKGHTFDMGSANVTLYALWAEYTPGLAFTSTGNECSVTAGTVTAGNVTIPVGWNAQPVTSIGDNAFYQCGVTSVSIPSSVTTIGDYAFFWCSGLTSIAIPSAVRSIGDHAFDYCHLRSIIIQSGVTFIGDHAFAMCPKRS